MMNNRNSNGASGGIGFCGLLTILFIALKLIGVIHWPWILVLCPLWFPIVVVVLILIFFK